MEVGRQRLGVAGRADEDAAGDAGGVDVLVARAGIAGNALADQFRRVKNTGDIAERAGRRVIVPRVAVAVAVFKRRPHVAVIGPGGMERRRCGVGQRVVAPVALGVDDKRRGGRHVNVVAHERRGALLEHGEVRRIDLELLERAGAARAHQIVRHPNRRGEDRCRARRPHRGPQIHSVAEPPRSRQRGPIINVRAQQYFRPRFTQVVIDQHQLAAGKRHGRHQLVAGLAFNRNRLRRGPGLAVETR